MAYTNNIPQPSDRISSSQAPILANFAAIDTVVSVNHVTFDDPSGNQGKHKFVSMPEQSSDPAVPADEAALYSKLSTLSGIAELFVKNENGDVIEFTSAGKANQGWTRLPSGILIKWASGEITAAAGQTTFTWPTGATIPAFTSVFGAWLTTRTSGNEDKLVQLNSATTTQVKLYGTRRTSTTVLQVNYNVVAIGV